MKVLIVSATLLALAFAAPVAAAEPVCVGHGPFAACTDPNDWQIAGPLPIYCLQVQDAPCP